MTLPIFQDKLGEVVFIQLPEIGTTLEAEGRENFHFG